MYCIEPPTFVKHSFVIFRWFHLFFLSIPLSLVFAQSMYSKFECFNAAHDRFILQHHFLPQLQSHISESNSNNIHPFKKKLIINCAEDFLDGWYYYLIVIYVCAQNDDFCLRSFFNSTQLLIFSFSGISWTHTTNALSKRQAKNNKRIKNKKKNKKKVLIALFTFFFFFNFFIYIYIFFLSFFLHKAESQFISSWWHEKF